jgi:glutamate synthase (NADPH) small chain
MNNPKGFLEIKQEQPEKRPVATRVRDWKEIYKKSSEEKVQTQAKRCMDCGVPFCHARCPLGNLIPEWNEFVRNGNWHEAYERLVRTNNFPDFTGVLCPAPCEAACVLSINGKAVTIKQIELAIIEKAFAEGWVQPVLPSKRNGMRVAIIGSGPAGLAAAQELNKKGYTVTVFERDAQIGGLLRYGIPEFKLEKWRLDRRLDLLRKEGIIFQPDTTIGVDLSSKDLQKKFDAVVLAIGSTTPRDALIPGRDLQGIHFAMEYLTAQNRRLEEAGGSLRMAGGTMTSYSTSHKLRAKDMHVVVIGGGDTGADCVGTAIRQGATSVTQLQHRPAPPSTRLSDNPWPEWPRILTVSSSQEEGGKMKFGIETKEFIGTNGHVTGIRVSTVTEKKDEKGKRSLIEIPGTEYIIKADLVLLAMGYTGSEKNGIVKEFNLQLTTRGTIMTDAQKMTSHKGVFAAGDAVRGQSLIVWAIAEGRNVAEGVDGFLTKKGKGML